MSKKSQMNKETRTIIIIAIALTITLLTITLIIAWFILRSRRTQMNNVEQWLYSDLIPFAGGFVILLILELFVPGLLNRFRESIEILPPPKGISDAEWTETTTTSKNRTGPTWVGRLERALFYLAFWMKSPELAGGWLIFKAAAKWEVWGNIIKVPEKLEGSNGLDYLGARHRWATRVLQTWLVSTMANALSGLLAAALPITIHQLLDP